MTARAPWSLTLLFVVSGALFLGCQSGAVVVGDDDDAAGDDDAADDDDAQGDDDVADDDDAGDDDDVVDDDDVADDDDDDDESPFAGEYEGEITMSVESPQGPMVFGGPLLATVSAAGAVTCNGEIEAPMESVLVEITGEASPDGGFTGEAYQGPANVPQQGPFETDGEFAVGGFEMRWSGSVPTPDGQEMPFQAFAEGWLL